MAQLRRVCLLRLDRYTEASGTLSTPSATLNLSISSCCMATIDGYHDGEPDRQLNSLSIDSILVLGFDTATCDSLKRGGRIGCVTSNYLMSGAIAHILAQLPHDLPPGCSVSAC